MSVDKPAFGALLLDFDGVLIDSEPIWWAIIDEVAQSRQLLAAGGQVERRSGVRVQDTIASLVGDDRRLVEALTREVFVTGEARLAGHPLMEGAAEAIREISMAGVVLGLVSSSNSTFLEYVLRANGIREHFSVLVGGDRVERGKPAPDCYLLAAREAGVHPSHCCAVEDSPTGILAAVAAGMYVVQFESRPPAADAAVDSHVQAVVSTFAALADIVFGR
jgi:HAD superfamily hydrolase (TIGR01509 family)